MKPADIHATHDVRDEGWLASDPVCQRCRYGVPHPALLNPCVGFYRLGNVKLRRPNVRGTLNVTILPTPVAAPFADNERWWAQRWIDKATPGEVAAMRELLGL